MSKLPFSIVNKSHYFNPNKDKVFLSIPSSSSHYSRVSKQQSYELRLYYEFKNCVKNNGQCFFYTLTYNDKSMPYFEGIPCFDYKDLVYFLNGGFKKYLLRHYGTNFKYFVGAELGEGKGSRGMESNPHYHVLFFLYNADSDDYPYVKISPVKFRNLVKKYWQSFDENTDGYYDYKTSGFGIAKEGLNLGLVTDFRAVSYVTKYVTKDVSLIKAERKLKKIFFDRHFYQEYYDVDNYREFLNEVVYPLIIEGDLPEFDYSFASSCQYLAPLLFKQVGAKSLSEELGNYFISFLTESQLRKDYDNFIVSKVDDLVRIDLNLFRNRYSNKCRISHGVGNYALDFLDGNYKIPVPTSNGYEMRSISLYYYRKLFYDVKKDAVGNNIYVLNNKGIDYKVNNLERSANLLTDRLNCYLSSVDKVFDDLSTVGYNPFSDFDSFKIKFDSFNRSKLINDYVYFKLVYEGRFFKIFSDRFNKSISFPNINFTDDYRKFLTPSFYNMDYDPDGASYFIKNFSKDYLSFSSHPYFSLYIDVFAVFDLLFNYFFLSKDNEIERIYQEVRTVKKFHDKNKLRSYYSNLFN